ncbi:thiol:disulfide interchange protein [Ralstonia mannitolilytica]|uniref:Protein-disulfide reductase DsbD n=1 Tax=Ralstonia pickettii TaxID=329 RepID=A0A7X2L9L8_RALPI|nr:MULTISPECIES: protein-disulfide reductase DsbD [Ralstonia]AJW43446.1 thiol:disulfide interchange protein [Ralstonia mannitolilytica]AJW47384.1 thiol:disulfide interchange protein [Ralstonia mannitolilytica]MRS98015.1 protein-disulfide reductase DsbD [Ralstonia pickettii]QIF09725.1 protein-disulfide reductase DsbD [Ralstonia mannitolilytica]CAJ0729578.1 Thiol:disulfide interchange protein DsbD [Ralstonia mannitolilytica]
MGWSVAATRTGDGGRIRRLAPAQLVWLLLAFTWLCIAGAAGVAHAAGEQDLLPPEQAFRFSARQLDDRSIEVHFDIADGYHLYRERFAFAAQPAGVKLGAPEFPPGQVKFDEALGKQMETYHAGVTIRVPVAVAPADGEWSLTVTSQGCADKGICYPPMKNVYKVGGGLLGGLFDKHRSSTPMTSLVPPATPTLPSFGEGQTRLAVPSAAPRKDNGDRIARVLASQQLGKIATVFLGFGLLLTLTPSVLAMAPILSSIVVGEHVTRGRALLVSSAYVLGTAVAHAGIGMAAGLLGERFSAGPWALGVFAALAVALALSMFGLCELGWQPPMAASANRWSGGRIAIAAASGVVAALVVVRSVPAPLAGALAYAEQTGDAVGAGGALFAMAIGMGVPLVLVGVATGYLVPHAGHWLKVTKRFLGFLLLGEAIWAVSPLLPPWVLMAAWAMLLLIAAAFLGAFDSLGPEPRSLARLGKGMGVVAALAGAILLVGLASGGRDLLQPLSHLRDRQVAPASTAGPALVRFERIRSVVELDARLVQAAAAGKPVLLDFYADWCVSCKEMERLTFSDPRVQARLAGVVLLQADVTRNTEEDRALLKRFGLFGPPGIILYGVDGRESPVRVIGFQSAGLFLDSLSTAWNDSGKR